MNESNLSPTDLTFELFRHGQGSEVVTARLAQLYGRVHGTKPDLTTDGAAAKRCADYISTSPPTVHVPIQELTEGTKDTKRTKAITIVNMSFLALSELIVQDATQKDKAYYARTFGISALTTERNLYAAALRSRPHPNPNPSDSAVWQRLLARQPESRLSFMRYYGEKRETTSYPELDELYSLAWGQVAGLPIVGRHAAALGRVTATIGAMHSEKRD